MTSDFNAGIEAAAKWHENEANTLEARQKTDAWPPSTSTIIIHRSFAKSIRELRRPEAVNDGPHIVTYETMTPDQIKEIIQEYRDDKEQLAHDFKTLWRNLDKDLLNRFSFFSNLGKNLQKEMREIYDISTPKKME